MNLKVGIVGLPNAGKSTLFNALLKRQVAEAANYPFTTIEPNVGVVPVPDPRLVDLAKVIEKTEGVKPPIVPAVVEFVDIAGLVKGAAQGEGLGNKFLSHIREVDLICNVVRYFTDPAVVHVAGEIDPARDKEIIETELILSDLQTLTKQAEPRGVADKRTQERWQLIQTLIKGLNEGKLARLVITDPDQLSLVRDLNLLTFKPIMYVANVAESQLKDKFPDDYLAISAKTESELASLSPDEQKAYLSELGLNASGLDRLIQKAYQMLGLISFLTAGVKEVRAWTIPSDNTAQQAAGVIHTDFIKKFIKADVVPLADFIAYNGWVGSREAGKVRSEGRDSVIKDGEVVEFKIGA